jgi:Holliday junction resolvase RusA-like endonuclease
VKPLTFEVPGDPVPQPRPRVSTRGGFARAYVPGKHPVHAYRASIAAAAVEAGATPTTTEPLTVILDLVFARPASHLTKKGLRKGAPALPRCDVDNAAKACLDALNGVAFEDDSQVAKLVVEKSYGQEARTTVRIQ